MEMGENPPGKGREYTCQAYADYNRPFIVHTDSSSYGLRAVLYQRQDVVEKFIAYAIKVLRSAKINYYAHI